jgi:hypothetical protein
MRRLALSCVLAFLGAGAAAGGEGAKHLDYRRTYGEALLEARIRNVCVMVSRHKDD